MIKVNIDEVSYLGSYIEECICGEIKTIDAVTEFLLARHAQNVLKKCELLYVKLKHDTPGVRKKLTLTDLELIAMNRLFSRVAVSYYLRPVEQDIMEEIRKYPKLIDVINNQIKWACFLS